MRSNKSTVLELFKKMSSEAFMHLFRRFIARIGLCATIYSDNARALKRSERERQQKDTKHAIRTCARMRQQPANKTEVYCGVGSVVGRAL